MRRKAVWGLVGAIFLSGSFLGADVRAAELSAGAQQQLRAATFEVVQLKPADGDLTYERALPMELMPYQQRTDLYRSVGTAFAIGPNRYVTAGHVIALGIGSQFGPPALRDAAGKVYAIDQVLKYSDHEDFVVFSLAEPAKQAQYLKAGAKPSINDTVFAVGNALGEGVVIRDGVYTSDSPEEWDGKWNWLRFTAAASPGNSGGPLVDKRGQLVGVVLRKSPSENLNYALSIKQVMDAPEGDGRLASRAPVRFPVMDAAETLQIDEHFKLPQPLTDFYKTWLGLLETATEHAHAQLLAHNAARLFPHGTGSERMLHFIERSPFPQVIHQAQNGTWEINGAKPTSVALEHNGFVEYNKGMVRLHAPDDVELGALYQDSKLQMELILKGLTLRRLIGTDAIRVTSLGKARSDATYTDSYGRVWQIRTWAIPYEDAMLTLLVLPTPEGLAGVYFRIPTGFWDLAIKEQQRLLDYVFMTLEGRLSRWQSYLAQKVARPKVFDSLKLEIEANRRLHFHSRLFDLELTPAQLRLSDQTLLRLNCAFLPDHDAVVWDVPGLYVAEESKSKNSVLIARRTAPSPDLPDGWQEDWHKMTAHEYPYNSMVVNEDGDSRIRTTVAIGTTVSYIVTVTEEGSKPQDSMKKQLDLLQHSFKPLE